VPIFERVGDAYLPTELARGPWWVDALHGGPVAALAVHAAERHQAAEGALVARVLVELVRQVPLAPLRPVVEVVHAGRATRSLRVRVEAAGQVVSLAHVLLLQQRQVRLPEYVAPRPPADSPDDGICDPGMAGDEVIRFHSHAVQIAFVQGSYERPGPTAAWIRLDTELIAGEQPTPAQRAAAIADLTGIGAALDGAAYTFPNADLSVRLHRYPDGEWLRLAADATIGPAGGGVATGVLADRHGPVGRVEQGIVVRESPRR